MRMENVRSTYDKSEAMHEAALNFDIKRLEPSFLNDPFPIGRCESTILFIGCRTVRIS